MLPAHATSAIGKGNALRPLRRLYVLFEAETTPTSTHAASAAVQPRTALHYSRQEPPLFSASSGEEEEKKRTEPRTYEPLRTPRPKAAPNFVLLSPIRCSTHWRGHNLSNGSQFDSVRCLGTKSPASKFSCAVRPTFSIEVPKSNVQNAVSPTVRHATRRVKNMRGLYV